MIEHQAPTRTNWAGNLTYQAKRVCYPNSLSEAQEWIARSPRIKPLGTQHSFNGIADTPEDQICLSQLPKKIALDRQDKTATFHSSLTYGALCRFLHDKGFALDNLASLPHISVAGSCATATHGSGVRNRILATQLESLELVDGHGKRKTFSRHKNAALFHGVVVGLGALGLVTRLTLRLQPSFQVRQVVYRDMPFATVLADFDHIVSRAHSVSLFTDWDGPSFKQVWFKSRCDEQAAESWPSELWGATRSDEPCHPVTGGPADFCTPQLGQPGPWHERLPHFRMEFTPSHGEELQSEYFVARSEATEALSALQPLSSKIHPLLLVSEIRSIAADEFWMSPCYQRDSVGIHFTWKRDWQRVRQVLPLIEKALHPFHPRPHWAKLSTFEPDYLAAQYPRWQDFAELMRQLDPQGKFRNPFLDRLFPA